MDQFLVVFLVIGTYEALVHLAPARVGARIGFWASAVAAVYQSLMAVDAAMSHRWLSLLWRLFIGTCCVVGMWTWSDDLRKARSTSEVSK